MKRAIATGNVAEGGDGQTEQALRDVSAVLARGFLISIEAIARRG